MNFQLDSVFVMSCHLALPVVPSLKLTAISLLKIDGWTVQAGVLFWISADFQGRTLLFPFEPTVHFIDGEARASDPQETLCSLPQLLEDVMSFFGG